MLRATARVEKKPEYFVPGQPLKSGKVKSGHLTCLNAVSPYSLPLQFLEQAKGEEGRDLVDQILIVGYKTLCVPPVFVPSVSAEIRYAFVQNSSKRANTSFPHLCPKIYAVHGSSPQQKSKEPSAFSLARRKPTANSFNLSRQAAFVKGAYSFSKILSSKFPLEVS